MKLFLCFLFLSLVICHGFQPSFVRSKKIPTRFFCEGKETTNNNNKSPPKKGKKNNKTIESTPSETKVEESPEEESPEVKRLMKKNEQLVSTLASLKAEKLAVDQELAKLDEEFGSEISRIKKEFARMKERSYEEAREAANKAKVDALKEVLPITDNYFRARQVFQPVQTESEEALLKVYDDTFSLFNKVIESFGVTRVQSLGEPFDFRYMEAIMTAPSTQYAADLVCTEYQAGYKMGDKSIRPAMVVVSTGPGPAV